LHIPGGSIQEKECDPHCLQGREHGKRARAKRKHGASKHAQNVAKRALVKEGRSIPFFFSFFFLFF